MQGLWERKICGKSEGSAFIDLNDQDNGHNDVERNISTERRDKGRSIVEKDKDKNEVTQRKRKINVQTMRVGKSSRRMTVIALLVRR